MEIDWKLVAVWIGASLPVIGGIASLVSAWVIFRAGWWEARLNASDDISVKRKEYIELLEKEQAQLNKTHAAEMAQLKKSHAVEMAELNKSHAVEMAELQKRNSDYWESVKHHLPGPPENPFGVPHVGSF